MPELPEVETTLRGISPHIIDTRITKITVRQPKLRWPIPTCLDKTLSQKYFHSARRRGKYLLLDSDSGSLLIHLGMSGSIKICHHSEAWIKHDHFAIKFATGKQLRLNDPRRFGAVLWQDGDAMAHPLLAKLGPEPLSDDFDAIYLKKSCLNRKTSIKQHIMNSHIVTGVGNIYACESLFMAGIHPKRAANKIAKHRLNRLVTSIKEVLMAAIEQGGTTLNDFTNADGKPGYFSQQLNVYGRNTEPCPVCNRPIKIIILGQRSTYYCSNCQR